MTWVPDRYSPEALITRCRTAKIQPDGDRAGAASARWRRMKQASRVVRSAQFVALKSWRAKLLRL
jgi:hypothetical protein